MTGKPYSIAEDAGVTETLAAAIAADPVVEDIFESLKWRLARDPQCGEIVADKGTEYRIAIQAPIKQAKNQFIGAAYSVDDAGGVVTIHAVKVYPYDDKQAYTPKEFGGV